MASIFTQTAATAIAGAQNGVQLVNALERTDPALATQLTGKLLIASKSPWGTLAAGAISWLGSAYGIGLSPDVSSVIAGVGVLAGSYAMRALTNSPINGVFQAPPPVASSPAPFTG